MWDQTRLERSAKDEGWGMEGGEGRRKENEERGGRRKEAKGKNSRAKSA